VHSVNEKPAGCDDTDDKEV